MQLLQTRNKAFLELQFNTLKQTVALINMKHEYEKSKDGYKRDGEREEEEEECRLQERKANIPDLVSQQFN